MGATIRPLTDEDVCNEGILFHLDADPIQLRDGLPTSLHTMTYSAVFQKLLNYCNVLRDDRMRYCDYSSTLLRTGPSAWLRTSSEQLTFLFLKIPDERTTPYSCEYFL